jgi:hypothetical protein
MVPYFNTHVLEEHAACVIRSEGTGFRLDRHIAWNADNQNNEKDIGPLHEVLIGPFHTTLLYV